MTTITTKQTTTSVAKRLCLLCSVLLLLSDGAVAQEGVAQELAALRISLEDAQSRAVGASHRLAEARARAATADATIAVRQAADRPIVTLGAGYTRTNHVTEFVVPSSTGVPRVLYPDAPDNYRAGLDLQWPIYSGGRADALERAAQAEASAAAADAAVAQADLRLEVARAFWALVTARATVAVLDRSLGRAQAHVNDVRQRLGAGLVAPHELASAEAQESRQRMLLIETRNRRDLSSAELARLIGADLLQPIEPAAALDLPAPLDPPEPGAGVPDRSGRRAAHGGRGQPAAGHRRHGWVRLRAAEPAHLPAGRNVGRLLGRGRRRHLVALGRRARARQRDPGRQRGHRRTAAPG